MHAIDAATILGLARRLAACGLTSVARPVVLDDGKIHVDSSGRGVGDRPARRKSSRLRRAFPEIVEVSGGGKIYSPNTPENLSQAWGELLNNPKELKKLRIKVVLRRLA